MRIPKHRPMTIWRALALQESKALRLLVRAHGRAPRAAPLTLPEISARDAQLILQRGRLIDTFDGPLLPMSDCGTLAGWRAHHRAGTPTCIECRRAHARETADYREIRPRPSRARRPPHALP